MASNQYILRISIAQPRRNRNNDDFVLLEQDPWEPLLGYVTKFGVYATINSILFQEDEPEPNCPHTIIDGNVYAYPSREDLNYIIGCSWGSLSSRRVQTLEFSEEIQVDLELELGLKYPALEIVSSGWIGPVYTSEGDIVNPNPEATVTTDGASLPEKVYGTLIITYKVCRHTYDLNIQPRPDAKENQLQSFVYACWDGGNTYMEMDIPEGSETEECNYRNAELDITPDDQPPDHIPPEDEYVDIDYCTGLEAI